MYTVWLTIIKQNDVWECKFFAVNGNCVGASWFVTKRSSSHLHEFCDAILPYVLDDETSILDAAVLVMSDSALPAASPNTSTSHSTSTGDVMLRTSTNCAAAVQCSVTVPGAGMTSRYCAHGSISSSSVPGSGIRSKMAASKSRIDRASGYLSERVATVLTHCM